RYDCITATNLERRAAPPPAQTSSHTTSTISPIPTLSRSACTRIRTSTHNLAIQRYRMNTRKKERHKRFCPHPECEEVVENIYHALLTCPAHYHTRRDLFDNLPQSSLFHPTQPHYRNGKSGP